MAERCHSPAPLYVVHVSTCSIDQRGETLYRSATLPSCARLSETPTRVREPVYLPFTIYNPKLAVYYARYHLERNGRHVLTYHALSLYRVRHRVDVGTRCPGEASRVVSLRLSVPQWHPLLPYVKAFAMLLKGEQIVYVGLRLGAAPTPTRSAIEQPAKSSWTGLSSATQKLAVNSTPSTWAEG